MATPQTAQAQSSYQGKLRKQALRAATLQSWHNGKAAGRAQARHTANSRRGSTK
jgi:hypothetical protein